MIGINPVTRIARIFNTYGPRMQPADGRVVSNFIVAGSTRAFSTRAMDASASRRHASFSDATQSGRG